MPLIEQVRRVEPGSVVHRHLSAEATVTQIGPVAYLPIADAYQVGQSIAGAVGQVYGLGAVGKDEPRPSLFIERLACSLFRAETCLGQRGVPGEDLDFRDEHVGEAVA